MIRRIGLKRFLILAVLTTILAALLFFSYFIFAPQMIESQQQLSKVSSEMSTLREEVSVMRDEYAKFEGRKESFEYISRTGFFNDQERVTARERFDAIRKLSRVISARYELRAAVIVQDDNVKDTGFVIMQTPISINLSALTDIDIYRFIYYLNYAYPGHIMIKSLIMERTSTIDNEVLREVGTGKTPEIVRATIELEWKTMARKEAVEKPKTLAPLVDESAAPAADGTVSAVPAPDAPVQDVPAPDASAAPQTPATGAVQ